MEPLEKKSHRVAPSAASLVGKVSTAREKKLLSNIQPPVIGLRIFLRGRRKEFHWWLRVN